MAESPFNECDIILQLVLALEKHTLNGHHFCSNHIVIELLYNLRKQVEVMKLKSLSSSSYDNTIENQSTHDQQQQYERNQHAQEYQIAQMTEMENVLIKYKASLLRAMNKISELEDKLSFEKEKSLYMRQKIVVISEDPLIFTQHHIPLSGVPSSSSSSSSSNNRRRNSHTLSGSDDRYYSSNRTDYNDSNNTDYDDNSYNRTDAHSRKLEKSRLRSKKRESSVDTTTNNDNQQQHVGSHSSSIYNSSNHRQQQQQELDSKHELIVIDQEIDRLKNQLHKAATKHTRQTLIEYFDHLLLTSASSSVLEDIRSDSSNIGIDNNSNSSTNNVPYMTRNGSSSSNRRR